MEFLTPELIEIGRDLIHRLDEQGMDIRSAFWWQDEDNGSWRLMLGTLDTRTVGSLALYRKVGRELERMGEPKDMPVYRVAIVDPKTTHLPMPRNSDNLGPIGDGVRVTDRTVGGVHLQDAYFYRLAARRKRAAAARHAASPGRTRAGSGAGKRGAAASPRHTTG